MIQTAISSSNDRRLAHSLNWNRYLYCRNDPVNYFDPDGREAIAFAAFMAYCSRLNTGFIAGMAAGYVTNQLTSGNNDKQQSFNATISGGTGNLLGNTIPIPFLSSIVSGVSQSGHNWHHDKGGPVDQHIRDVEERTRAQFEERKCFKFEK